MPARSAFLLDRHHGLPDTLASAHAFAADPCAGVLARLHTHRADAIAGALAPPVPAAGRGGRWWIAAAVAWVAVAASHLAGLGTVPTEAGRSASADLGDGPPALPSASPVADGASQPARGSRSDISGLDPSARLGPVGAPVASTAGRPADKSLAQPSPGSLPVLGRMTAVGPGRVGEAARRADTAEILAARDDLAQALSALFRDAEPAPDDTTTQAGGIGLPEAKKPRRVESPRGGSEAGRTHLAVGGDTGQGEVAPLRSEGNRAGMQPPPADGRWQSDKSDEAPGGRTAPVNASVGSQGGGGVAPPGQSSEGVQAAELRLGPEVPVASARTTPATLGPALARRGPPGERLRERVPTALQATRVPLPNGAAFAGPSRSESVRDDTPLSAEYRAAARDYALSLNRSPSR